MHCCEQAIKNYSENNTVFYCGIKGYTPLLQLPYINIPLSIPTEPMHLITLGIIKTLIGIWTHKKNKSKSFYLNETKLKQIHNAIKLTTLPHSDVSARLNGMKNIKFIKYFKVLLNMIENIIKKIIGNFLDYIMQLIF